MRGVCNMQNLKNVNKMNVHVFTIQLKKLHTTSSLAPCVEFYFICMIVHRGQCRCF